MTIFTIGFTKKSAEEFFKKLHKSGAKHLLDIRLNNTSQLAGFTKRDDLSYFLRKIVNIEYHLVPLLAPTKEILKEYQKTSDWMKYEQSYLKLMQERQVERKLDLALFHQGAILLCSEVEPDKCHRRLTAEYLIRSVLTGTIIKHL